MELYDFISTMLVRAYGVAPIAVLQKDYQIYFGKTFTMEELRKAEIEQPKETDKNTAMEWFIDGLYVSLDDDDPSKPIGNEEYYIPSQKEIKQLLEKGYVVTPASQAFRSLLTVDMRADKATAEGLLKSVWATISLGETFQNVVQMLADGKVETLDQLSKVTNVVANYYNTVFRSEFCGYSPALVYEKLYGMKVPML